MGGVGGRISKMVDWGFAERFFSAWLGREILVFLQGVLGKCGVLTWCFDGVVVVRCVVNVVFWQALFGA